MSRGCFITLEGGEGSGKSTILEMISKQFPEYIFTREPGGTDISEKLRTIILDKENIEMNERCEALLYAASRAQHIEEFIKPNLELGSVIICDRFVESSLVYQGMARDNNLEDIILINKFATQNFAPDVTIYFDVNPSIGLKRVESRNKIDRLDLETFDFHTKIYEGYKRLYENELYTSKKFYVVDASLSIEEVFQNVVNVISESINE